MVSNEFLSLLQSVAPHWQQSAKAYADYMDNGKKFRFAEVLKLHNTAVKNLLTENITVVPGEFLKDVQAIIEHYNIWTSKWDELRAQINPGPGDVFVFENDHRFPRSEAQKLEALLG